MALDTFKKRAAMLNFGGGNTWHTLPVPDSTPASAPDLGDRRHMLDLHRGGALTTKAARLSMLNFGGGATLHTLFEPEVEASVSFDLLDRLHLLDLILPEVDAPIPERCPNNVMHIGIRGMSM